jgi:ribonuclease P protein component
LCKDSALVVRALPPAAEASSAELGADLDSALRRLGLLPARQAGGTDESRRNAGNDNARPAP